MRYAMSVHYQPDHYTVLSEADQVTGVEEHPTRLSGSVGIRSLVQR